MGDEGLHGKRVEISVLVAIWLLWGSERALGGGCWACRDVEEDGRE